MKEIKFFLGNPAFMFTPLQYVHEKHELWLPDSKHVNLDKEVDLTITSDYSFEFEMKGKVFSITKEDIQGWDILTKEGRLNAAGLVASSLESESHDIEILHKLWKIRKEQSEDLDIISLLKSVIGYNDLTDEVLEKLVAALENMKDGLEGRDVLKFGFTKDMLSKDLTLPLSKWKVEYYLEFVAVCITIIFSGQIVSIKGLKGEKENNNNASNKIKRTPGSITSVALFGERVFWLLHITNPYFENFFYQVFTSSEVCNLSILDIGYERFSAHVMKIWVENITFIMKYILRNCPESERLKALKGIKEFKTKKELKIPFGDNAIRMYSLTLLYELRYVEDLAKSK